MGRETRDGGMGSDRPFWARFMLTKDVRFANEPETEPVRPWRGRERVVTEPEDVAEQATPNQASPESPVLLLLLRPPPSPHGSLPCQESDNLRGYPTPPRNPSRAATSAGHVAPGDWLQKPFSLYEVSRKRSRKAGTGPTRRFL